MIFHSFIDRLILGKLWSLYNTQINVFMLLDFGHLVSDLSVVEVSPIFTWTIFFTAKAIR